MSLFAPSYGFPPEQYAHTKRGFELFLQPGQVTELRALEVSTDDYRRPHTVSGYFNDLDKLTTAALNLSGNSKGVYFIPNEVNPALLARAVNRVQPVSREPLTSDRDIIRRRFLLIDFDPARPAGISSSAQEHMEAMAKASDVYNWLTSNGWSQPLVVDSGNGVHLDYRVDLPIDGDLVASVLAALAFRFSDELVHIDTSVCNPARIWKVMGTLACKGDSTVDRPHRFARLIQAPSQLLPVARDLLEEMARLAPPAAAAGRRTTQTFRGGSPQRQFDLAGWLTDHNLEVVGPQDWRGGRRWIFVACPWDSSHTNRSAYVVQFASGAIAAGCHHDGCAGRDWHALRDVVEPGWRDQRANTPGIQIPPSTPAAVQRALRQHNNSHRHNQGTP